MAQLRQTISIHDLDLAGFEVGRHMDERVFYVGTDVRAVSSGHDGGNPFGRDIQEPIRRLPSLVSLCLFRALYKKRGSSYLHRGLRLISVNLKFNPQ